MEELNLPYVNTPETIGYPPDKDRVQKIIEKVADRIIQNTSYRFIHQKNGDFAEESRDLPIGEKYKLESGFNDWKYWNGVIHLAFHEMAESFNDHRYAEYVRHNYEFAFRHLDFFQKLFNARIPNANFHQFFRLDRLDDFGAMAAGLIPIYMKDKKDEYGIYLERVLHYISEKQDRLKDGTFCRNRFGYTSLWGDDLYMSVPFLVRAWKLTNDEKYLDDAIRQVVQFHKYLYRPENGLMYHCKILQVKQFGVAHWGRANGWMMMGQVELLKHLPDNHPKRQELIDLLLKQIVGVSRYQSSSGVWRQILDKTDSFLETSSTAMFIRCIAAAVNEGWIDDIFASIAVSGWNGLVNYIKEDGEFTHVSTGFNIKQDLAYYYNRPLEEGGDHGLGALLSAGMEIYKMKEYRDCVWC